MGFKVTWIAVSGKGRNDIFSQLNLADSGQVEDLPESPVCAADLPGGWTLLFFNRFDHPLADKTSLETLSRDGLVLVCQIHEGVMYSGAQLYENGRNVWSVAHDAQKDMYDVEVGGSPPPAFAQIHADLKATQDAQGGRQADVDFLFDVPLKLAETLCGFKHDEAILSELRYTVLRAKGEQ